MDDICHDKEEHWMSVSDLMTILMMVFLLITILKIKLSSEEQSVDINLKNYEQIKKELSNFIYQENKLYSDLEKEFVNDFGKWNATLNRDNLTISFNKEKIMFRKSSYLLKDEYKDILQDFFPRYVKILKKNKNIIQEVRIQGHTSSEWKGTTSYKEAYFENMGLSQNRAKAVLEYSMKLPKVEKNWQWIKSNITANGLSSSKLKMRTILDEQVEDSIRSRRVEFKVLTKTKQLVNKIKKISQQKEEK
ncbi:MAG: OmpA family protein [Alphaproteobacteria bacterium]|nr:OmpA family protein [Alphaproteobacteria bacterium]